MASNKKQLIRFATRDNGWVFVDPETYKVVRVVKGKDRQLPADTDWAHDHGSLGLEREDGEKPPFPITTYRPLAGARQNNRGQSVLLSINGDSPSFQTIQSVVESPRSSGEDAESILVTLGMQYESEAFGGLNLPDPTVPQRTIEGTAILDWGVGGVAFSAEVDWQQGTIFTLPASSLNVGLRVFTAGGVGFADTNVRFLASLSYGSSYGTVSNARKTTFHSSLDVAPPNNTHVFVIPKWATSFTINGQKLPGGGVESLDLFLLRNPAAGPLGALAHYRYDNITNVGRQDSGTYPIPNSARFLRVNNLSTDSWAIITVMFNLAFS